MEGVKHIVSVASGKGGVGKSTTAVNLAVSMAKTLGLKVGLLDADIYGPSIPRLLNIHPRKPDVDSEDRMIPLENHSVRSMSIGYLMDATAAAVWRGPMVMSALDTFISKVSWAPLDILLIDMPPGTGDAQITITQKLALSGSLIVTTPQELAVMDARRGVTMFQKVNVPVLGVIENMSYYVCECCGNESYIFGKGGADALSKEMGIDVLGHIPLQTAIQEGSDHGQPVLVSDPDSATAAAYNNLAALVWKKLSRFDRDGTPSIRSC